MRLSIVAPAVVVLAPPNVIVGTEVYPVPALVNPTFLIAPLANKNILPGSAASPSEMSGALILTDTFEEKYPLPLLKKLKLMLPRV